MKHTLEVYVGERLIFHSDGRWLHPLFDLERFLREAYIDPATLLVRDKIVGRAAALLLIYLCAGTVEAGILSRLGQEILERYEVPYRYDTLVDRIDCRTEQILHDETDPHRAVRLLRRLAEGTDERLREDLQ